MLVESGSTSQGFLKAQYGERMRKTQELKARIRRPTPLLGEGAQTDQVSFIRFSGRKVHAKENVLSEAYGAIWLLKIG